MKFYFLSILFFSHLILNAQITFKKQFRSALQPYASTVLQTYDHGYFILGVIRGSGVVRPKMLLIKTNEIGDTLWSKIYSNCANVYSSQGVVQCPDSGFAVLGRTTGAYLLRLNKNGDSLWGKELGSGNPRVIEISPHNEFIITGSDSTILFIRANNNGDLIIHKNISILPPGYIASQWGSSIKPTYDNGTIIGGTSDWIADSYAFLAKTDYNGNLQWVKRFSYLEMSACNSIDITKDTGFVLAGGFYYGAFLFKTNFFGDTLWEKIFGFHSGIGISSIATCDDGDYIACGSKKDSSTRMDQILLMKTNQEGSTIWSKMLYSAELLVGWCVKQTYDGGFVILGEIQENDSSPIDLILVKTDPFGEVSWIKPIRNVPSFSVYPNPASEYISIENPEKSINATIEIFDLTGKCRLKTKTDASKNVVTISIDSLESGEFLLKISNGTDISWTTKIIKI